MLFLTTVKVFLRSVSFKALMVLKTELNNALRMFVRHSWNVSTGVENEFYEVGFDYVQSFFSQN